MRRAHAYKPHTQAHTQAHARTHTHTNTVHYIQKLR